MVSRYEGNLFKKLVLERQCPFARRRVTYTRFVGNRGEEFALFKDLNAERSKASLLQAEKPGSAYRTITYDDF